MIKIFRWTGIVALVGLGISVGTPVWNYAASLLLVVPVIAKADAIVVLGSGIGADGTLSDESLRRTVHGMQLFKQGLAPVLVLSGPVRREPPWRSEAGARRDLAMQMGIPPDRILTIERVLTTQDEASQTATALGGHETVSVLLVTEGLHMRRAMRLFERAGLKVLPAPSDNYPPSASSPKDRLRVMVWFLEQGGAFAYYRLSGAI